MHVATGEDVVRHRCPTTHMKPLIGVQDIAVAAARKAFEEGPWPTIAPAARGALMLKLALLIERDLMLLASIESLDNGKSITMAKGDVGAVAATIRYYGGWADKIHGKVVDTQNDRFNFVRYEPIGVCGQIIPWNFPLLMVVLQIFLLRDIETDPFL